MNGCCCGGAETCPTKARQDQALACFLVWQQQKLGAPRFPVFALGAVAGYPHTGRCPLGALGRAVRQQHAGCFAPALRPPPHSPHSIGAHCSVGRFGSSAHMAQSGRLEVNLLQGVGLRDTKTFGE